MSAHFLRKSFLLLVLSMASFALLPAQTLADEAQPIRCGTYTVQPSFFGAGMVQGIEQFSTTNPRVVFRSTTEKCAVVVWEASTPTASAVVYAPQDSAPTIPVLTDEKYGFMHITPQDNAGNNRHIAILTELAPDTVYVFRTITRAHPTALPHISTAYTVHTDMPTNTFTSTPETTQAHVPATPPSRPQQQTTFETTSPANTTVHAGSQSTTGKTTTFPEYNSVSTTIPEPSTMIPSIDFELQSDVDTSVPTALSAALDAHDVLPQRDGFVPLADTTKIAHVGKIVLLIVFVGVAAYLLYSILGPSNVFIRIRPVVILLVLTAVIAVGSVALMWYYLALIGIAGFLALLAWYLISSVPESDEHATTAHPTQPKLLDAPKDDTKNTQ